ncbi:Copper chaperone CopZ [Sporobacter termitidis DSM 10068]|uniref:Copper chaperone CopZ n=1 Tax=Sporobacter termitidis DSM 10068 TaxID=1123282 RepID=A0A1M5XHH2_9FIRM|nr:heavy metal-associated domain-containing protein [Sporobacter termitidis]SHH99270.1 Copper chaperone CopZ [Sporobacter termitidis DSM 10068]
MAATIIICVIIAAAVVFGVLRYRKNLRSGCCGSGNDPAPKKLRVSDSDLSHYPYEKLVNIDGMTCRNCVTHVQNALNSLDGVYARVDLGRKQAAVHMKEELPDQTLRKAVADAGYTAGHVCAVLRPGES